jgi:hypothetical protein
MGRIIQVGPASFRAEASSLGGSHLVQEHPRRWTTGHAIVDHAGGASRVPIGIRHNSWGADVR